MIFRNIGTLTRKINLKSMNKIFNNQSQIYRFSIENKSEKRFQEIRMHTTLSQYPELNSKIKEHLKNSIELIQDQQTGLRFLVETGGFAGCSDMGICVKLGTQDQNDKNAGSLQCLKSFVHMKPTFEQLLSNYQILHQTGSSFDLTFDSLTTYGKCSFLEEDQDLMMDLLLDLVLREKNMFEDNHVTQIDLDNLNQLVRRTAFGFKGLGMPSKGVGNTLTPKSTYVGGLGSFNSDGQNFQFAVAFPSVPSRSQNMELYNILRVLLGSASSFSSGGPGKGMHSRCTKNLLNFVQCVQKASYINEHFEEHGLFGLSVGGPHDDKNKVIEATLLQMSKLAQLIPQQELEKAKHILISSIYQNIQRQPDRLQQLTKHIYYYSKIKLYEFEHNIRKVTAKQIQNQMNRIFKLKPTFVYSGNNKSLLGLPNQKKLNQKFSTFLENSRKGKI